MKERLTVTIDEEIINRVDESIDGHNVKNRSHAFEVLLNKALKPKLPKKAVILCGGQGTRLRPLTYEIPKALIPVHGKTLTEHLFDLFKKYGVEEIYMAVGHMKDKIMNFFGNGDKFGLKIHYIIEEDPLGTGGPLKKLNLNEPFFCTNGDELKDINLEEMYSLHKKENATVTIALTTVEDPSQYGVARLNGSKIQEFVEKPKENAPSKLINSGFYIIEPQALSLIPDGFAMLEKEVFPRLASEDKLTGYPFSGQWFDTGNMERYEKAIKEWRGFSE